MISLWLNWNVLVILDFNFFLLLYLFILIFELRLVGFINIGYVNLLLINLMILFLYFLYLFFKKLI